MAIPPPRFLLTNIVSNLQSTFPLSTAATTQHPLETTHREARDLLLTLHVLFPNQFLPALDVLDRRLVTRFLLPALPGSPSARATQERPGIEHKDPHNRPPTETGSRLGTGVYLVRSAQDPDPTSAPFAPSQIGSTRRFRNATQATQERKMYETHLRAWNCSCPAFTFSAFPAATEGTAHEDVSTAANPGSQETGDVGNEQSAADENTGAADFLFGGRFTLPGAGEPVCKHLLACCLAEQCPYLFADFVEERVGSLEELAGWCAGWGG